MMLMNLLHGMQSASVARAVEEVSAAGKPASAGGRWWLQSWFPDWSGWYGTQAQTDEQPSATDISCASTDSENALGNNNVLYCKSGARFSKLL